MKRHLLIYACCIAAVTAAAASRTATEAYVTNKIAAAVASIPAPDFTTNNATLVATIEVTSPRQEIPEEISTLTNVLFQVSPPEYSHYGWHFAGTAEAARYASFLYTGQSGQQIKNMVFDGVPRWAAYTYLDTFLGVFAYQSEITTATNALIAYTDAATNAIPRNFLPLTGGTMEGTVYFEPDEGLVFGDYFITDGSHGDGAGIYRYSDDGYEPWMLFGQFPTNGLFRVDDTSTLNYKGKLWGDDSYSIYLGFPFDAYDVNYWLPPQTDGTGYPADVHLASTSYVDRAIASIPAGVTPAAVTNAAVAVTSAAISTNNAAFVEAVLAAPIAGADSSDLAEIGEYGSYGTVGAAILALIAGLAALKRGKADKTELPYDIVAVTPANGVVTVQPRTVAIYTAQTSAVAFEVAVGTVTGAKARDCELVIDCTATGAVAPTVTWPATFHPRTDAATDFACEAGKRNVYFISEYAPGEFAVGGWQETAGGNA